MKRTITSKFIAAAVFAGAALGLSSVAQARPDVQLSISLPGLPGLPIFFQTDPGPVYFQREPVYVPQRPVYAPPQVVYERPWSPSYRYAYEGERGWQHGNWQRREWEHRHGDRSRSHDRNHRD